MYLFIHLWKILFSFGNFFPPTFACWVIFCLCVGGAVIKNPLANAGDARDACLITRWGRSPEEEMAVQSSILAWKIPWTKEPGRLQSMALQRVRHAWVTELNTTHHRLRLRVLYILRLMQTNRDGLVVCHLSLNFVYALLYALFCSSFSF